jgi:hypothetical protein
MVRFVAALANHLIISVKIPNPDFSTIESIKAVI